MDWHALLAILSALLATLGNGYYVWDILRGTSRPNAVSVLLWTVLESIAAIAQIAAGPSWSLAIVASLALSGVVILFLCAKGYGYWKYGPIDYGCFVLGALAIALWLLTSNPLIAIWLSILASAIGDVPTLVKTYRHPHTEHPFTWFLFLAGSLFSIAATTKFDVANLAFPLYLAASQIAVMVFALAGRTKAK